MAKFKKRITDSYGLSAPYNKTFPTPIIASRDPTSSDFAEQGQVWINESSNSTFVLTSNAGGAANWEQSSGNEINPPLEIDDSIFH